MKRLLIVTVIALGWTPGVRADCTVYRRLKSVTPVVVANSFQIVVNAECDSPEKDILVSCINGPAGCPVTATDTVPYGPDWAYATDVPSGATPCRRYSPNLYVSPATMEVDATTGRPYCRRVAYGNVFSQGIPQDITVGVTCIAVP